MGAMNRWTRWDDAACTRSGRVKKRAGPTERVLARVCREAGARVKFNAALRDMNLGVPGADERWIEVLAQDLPCFGGAQLAIDITLRSALCATGEPQPGAAEVDGAVLVRAWRDKENAHPDLVTSRRCRLVVVAIEGAAGVTKQRISCGNWRRRRHARRRHSCSTRPHWLGNAGGRA